MGLFDKFRKTKGDGEAVDRDAHLKRRPGYETVEETRHKEAVTGELATDSIDFSQAMPDANLKSLFINQSSITGIGIAGARGSGVKDLMSKLVGGFMNIAEQWLAWREDDNCVTYLVRAMLGIVLAVYVFYVLYCRHLDRYVDQVKRTLSYTLELDN